MGAVPPPMIRAGLHDPGKLLTARSTFAVSHADQIRFKVVRSLHLSAPVYSAALASSSLSLPLRRLQIIGRKRQCEKVLS